MGKQCVFIRQVCSKMWFQITGMPYICDPIFANIIVREPLFPYLYYKKSRPYAG
jgi:hypothetical protein